MRIKVSNVTCPKCGAGEMHPDGDKLLIRAFKVCHDDGHWWSQCLVCAGYYNPDLTSKPIGKDGLNPDFDRSAGWF
jgi:hypothetical protein